MSSTPAGTDHSAPTHALAYPCLSDATDIPHATEAASPSPQPSCLTSVDRLGQFRSEMGATSTTALLPPPRIHRSFGARPPRPSRSSETTKTTENLEHPLGGDDASRLPVAPVPYLPYPVTVSRAFREFCLAAYPALAGDSKDAVFYRRMLQYLIFSHFEDEDEEDGKLVLPATTVAALYGVPPTRRGFRADACLEAFSQNVFPLQGIRGHRYTEKKARTVDRYQSLPPELFAQWNAENILRNDWQYDWPKTAADARKGGTAEKNINAVPASKAVPAAAWVEFVSGKAVKSLRRHPIVKQYTQDLRCQAEERTPRDHPVRPLMQYLNGPQGKSVLCRILRRNWDNLLAAYATYALVPDTRGSDNTACDDAESAITKKRARDRRAAALRTLKMIQEFPHVVYFSTDRTPRLYAMHLSVNQLPRGLRKIALSGCVEMDAVSCQLAIVAKLWQLPRLTAFLGRRDERGERLSVWTELLQVWGVAKNAPEWDEYKALAKQAVYSIIFGMYRKNVCTRLVGGSPQITGLGNIRQAKAFLRHPLMKELMRERDVQLQRIKEAGGVTDAFGRFLPTRPGIPLRSLLSQEVQSHELALMLPLFEVAKSEKKVHIVSWLHDGITVWFSDKKEQARQVRRLHVAFRQECEQRGFDTDLDASPL